MQRGKRDRRLGRAVGVAALVCGLAFVGVANQDAPGQTTDGYLARVTSAATADPVVAVAGDIACRPGSTSSATRCQQMATSDLLLAMNPDAVLTLGDNQYETGTLAEFQGVYGPSWGRLLDRTYPTPGNHEYNSPGAAGYYAYFGPRAGDPSKGYYSLDVGAWHLIALNSECGDVGGCGQGSPQETWLRTDLAAHPAACTLAYWHKPRFSSGGHHPSDASFQPLWQALWDARADVVLSGHAHHYERFAPQAPDGAPDSVRGIRQFIVGTGGRNHQDLGQVLPNTEVRQNTSFGVLKLVLHETSYDWEFVSAAGRSFTDSGSRACHTASTPPVTTKPIGDFDGDGDTDRSVFRGGAWFAEGQTTSFLGLASDIPVPADYDGDGTTDRAVYRDGAWFIAGQPTVFFGLAGDVPVPGDYDGDYDADRAIFRPSVGGWYVEGQAPVFFGLNGDIPVPGDYDGNGSTERAVWRPAVGGWYVNGQTTQYLGLNGDIPVPGDYDGNGSTDRGVWRPAVGGWYIDGQTTVYVGLNGDIPVPGDYDGNGTTDRGIWRPAVGGWYVNGQTTIYLGLNGDIPLPLPPAIYRRFF